MLDKIKEFKAEGLLDQMMGADIGAERMVHAHHSKDKHSKDLMGDSPARVIRRCV